MRCLHCGGPYGECKCTFKGKGVKKKPKKSRKTASAQKPKGDENK